MSSPTHAKNTPITPPDTSVSPSKAKTTPPQSISKASSTKPVTPVTNPSSTKTTPATPPTVSTSNVNNDDHEGDLSFSTMSFEDIEYYLRRSLRSAKRLARSDVASEEVMIAKIADYALRELHSKGVRPMTAIRAMVLMETAEEKRAITGCMHQALRMMRDEARERRGNMTAEGGEEDGGIDSNGIHVAINENNDGNGSGNGKA